MVCVCLYVHACCMIACDSAWGFIPPFFLQAIPSLDELREVPNSYTAASAAQVL